MDIDISIDSKGVNKAIAWLAQIQGQIPYASSRALNDSAKAAADDLNRSTSSYFDRPTKFTQKGYGVSKFSSKTDLEAQLNLRPLQARYLLPSITGGIRPQRPSERKLQGVAAWRPGIDANLNSSGNISKAQAVKALQDGPSYFRVDTRRGKLRPGIYQRMAKGRVKSIISFNALPDIRRRWPIHRVTTTSLAKYWPGRINYWMDKATKG